MRIVVREEITESAELRGVWNDLALRMEHPEVFYTYEWAVAVQRAYGNSRKPLLFLGYEGETLVGLSALARENDGSGDVVFLTASTADYCDFLSEPARRSEFVGAVVGELRNRKMGRVILTNLPADSSTVGAISAAARNSDYKLHSRTAYFCARVILGSVEERSALKLATANKRKLRRSFRQLEKKGPVCVRHDSEWGQIEPILPSFNQAQVARFLSTGRISNLLGGERRKFLYELARELSSSGWLVISRLLAGEVAVAWNYGFNFAGSWFWYQPTVEAGRQYADASPGYCLLAKIVERACDGSEVKVIDLGLGAEEYKDRFATANRETLYCVLNRSLPAHLGVVARDAAAALAKASPRMESYLRGIISYITGLRARIREAGFWGASKGAARRARSFLFASDETLFFEWEGGGRNFPGMTGVALDSNILGAAAIRYADDPGALAFLMGAAQRLRVESVDGFALVDGDRTPLQFCLARDFEGVERAELQRNVHAPGKNAVMLFDYFCPASAGGGFVREEIGALADQLLGQGKIPWISADATNERLRREIESAGFTYRFSLKRSKILFFKKTRNSTSSPAVKTLSGSARGL